LNKEERTGGKAKNKMTRNKWTYQFLLQVCSPFANGNTRQQRVYYGGKMTRWRGLVKKIK